MTFRTRLVIALVAATIVPLAVFAYGIRREVTNRLSEQFEQRVEALVVLIEQALDDEATSVAARLRGLAATLPDDNRLRAGLINESTDRHYVLDYASGAMTLMGLSMLQIQEASGRILSSGHFRNEFDRVEPELPRQLAAAPRGLALVEARTPEAPFVALAAVDSFRVAERRYYVVGGLAFDALERRLGAHPDLSVRLVLPNQEEDIDSGDGDGGPMVRELTIPAVVNTASGSDLANARVLVTHPLTELRALRRRIDLLFAGAAVITAVVAVVLASWLASRISRPLTKLARQTSEIDLERLNVAFAGDRRDEIGTLARLLTEMTTRLRASAQKLRDAERRSAIGEVARQVNHDIKNGLVPIRNVVRHLAEVGDADAAELARVFRERLSTLESSIDYLEGLASNYAKLSPRVTGGRCDVNDVVREVVEQFGDAGHATVTTELVREPALVAGDAVVLRRILENLVRNGVDSLDGARGTVTIATDMVNNESDAPAVRITVADTGVGMTEKELERAFEDFYTTKTTGTGLGLSVVRRLVLDLNGSLRVESKPGAGSRFTVELPRAQAIRSSGESRRVDSSGQPSSEKKRVS